MVSFLTSRPSRAALTSRLVADAFVELRISILAESSNFESLQFNPLASALQRMSTMLVLMI
jgi:hypothetical protein